MTLSVGVQQGEAPGIQVKEGPGAFVRNYSRRAAFYNRNYRLCANGQNKNTGDAGVNANI